MGGHAFLAPSGAEQWGPGRCPGSPSLQAQFPDEDGLEAREGTVAHWYASELLLGRHVALGTVHENGLPVVQEMVEATAEYVTDCRQLIARAHAEGGAFYVEQRVYAHTFINPHVDGTPDFFAIFPRSREIWLKDYKHGHGYVDAFRNYQVAVYLIAVFETLGLGVPDDTWTIRGDIYQPRNYHPSGHVRTWRPKGSELEAMRGRFAQAAAEALATGALCRVGPWCRHCKAAHACTTLAEAASFARSHASAAQLYHQDPADLGRELKANKRAMELLKARAEALEEEAMAIVSRGGRVLGWRGEYRKGRTAWSVPVERAIAWCKALGADISKPAALTPNQALKLDLTPEMIEAITSTPSTYVLAEVSQDDLARGLSENG